MMISHKKRFIFIHNYKVAGTSIRDALNGYNNYSFRSSTHIDKVKLLLGLYPRFYASQFPGHITAGELKDRTPPEIFNNYYKFGFVRNPWDWQVSLYTYMLKLETHYQHKLIKSMKNFDEYIDWRVNNALRLQKDFFYEGEGNFCLVDFIGKMENLTEDFAKVCNRIGVNAQPPHLNSSRNENDKFLKYYSQKSIDIVYEAFNEDVKLFGYSKPEL